MCTKWKSILTNFCHMRRYEYFCNFTITKCICTDYFKRRIIRNFNCLNLWTSVKRFLTNFCDITWNCILDELLNTFTQFISYFEFCSNSAFYSWLLFEKALLPMILTDFGISIISCCESTSNYTFLIFYMVVI